MMAFLVVFSLLWNRLAPLPPQVAINPETKECGNFWGGDEYGGYQLSPPWKIVNYGTPVQIGAGVYQWDGGISSASVESFCKQIGYTYLSGNLGQLRGEYRWTAYAYILLATRFAPWLIALVIVLVAFIIFLRWQRLHTSPS